VEMPIDNFGQTKQETTEEDFEVEITDLEPPGDGKSNKALWPAAADRFLAWQHSLNRKHLRLSSTISIPILTLLVILLSLPNSPSLFSELQDNLAGLQNSLDNLHPLKASNLAEKLFSPPEIKPALRIMPQQDGLTCLIDGMWSQDNTQIAFLGYRQDCPNGFYQTGLVAVNDALSGKQIALLWPDKAILQAFHSRFPQEGVPVIYYQHILWSPHGQHLALTFLVEFSSSESTTVPGFNGVLLTDEMGKHMQVLLQPEKRNFRSYTEWDLALGVTVATPSLPPVSSTYLITLPVALVYRWEADGSLVPFGRLTGMLEPFGVPPGPVGYPDGSGLFTLWQPGWVQLPLQPDGSRGPPFSAPDLYTWNTVFAAWSPDGRYIADSIFIGGRLALPGASPPSRQTLIDFQLEKLPLLRLHDVALQSILKALSVPVPPGDSNAMMVAWSRSGRLMAAYDPGDKGLGSKISLYNTTTGRQVASLFLPATPPGLGVVFPQLHWSPDSSHLFLLDPHSGSIVIWTIPGQS
jgi:hypothetical protein